SLDDVQAADELALALFRHRRQDLLHSLSRDPEHLADLGREEHEINRWLKAIRKNSDDPRELALVEDVERAAGQYLELSRSLRGRAEPLANSEATRAPFFAAQERVDDLVESNAAEA